MEEPRIQRACPFTTCERKATKNPSPVMIFLGGSRLSTRAFLSLRTPISPVHRSFTNRPRSYFFTFVPHNNKTVRCFLRLARNQLLLRSHVEHRRIVTLKIVFAGWKVGVGRLLRARLLPPAEGDGQDGGNDLLAGGGSVGTDVGDSVGVRPGTVDGDDDTSTPGTGRSKRYLNGCGGEKSHNLDGANSAMTDADSQGVRDADSVMKLPSTSTAAGVSAISSSDGEQDRDTAMRVAVGNVYGDSRSTTLTPVPAMFGAEYEMFKTASLDISEHSDEHSGKVGGCMRAKDSSSTPLRSPCAFFVSAGIKHPTLMSSQLPTKISVDHAGPASGGEGGKIDRGGGLELASSACDVAPVAGVAAAVPERIGASNLRAAHGEKPSKHRRKHRHRQ